MSSSIVQKKIKAAKLFDCSDLNNFVRSIIASVRFNGISFARLYICELQGVLFLTKTCFYRKQDPELYLKLEKTHMMPVDTEIAILKIFREKLIERQVTPCILELVHDQVCAGLKDIMPDEKTCDRLLESPREYSPHYDMLDTLCAYKDLIRAGIGHDKMAFLVLERCDVTLYEYLRTFIATPVSIAIFKSLLFQIIYTMYAILRLYPKFRHYDLHTDNIMLKFDPEFKFRADDMKFLVFHVDDIPYSIPYFGIFVKIIDFGFSSLPEEGVVSTVTMDPSFVYNKPTNDLVFLFYWIYYNIESFPHERSRKIEKMLTSLEPNRSFAQSRPDYIRKIEHLIPTSEQMVKNKIFDKYRKYKAPKSQIYREYFSTGKK